jgi:hypothetical protein
VPTHSEEILDDTVQAEESLSLTGRLEAAHVLFPLAGKLMRGLDTIVGVPFRVVGYSTQDRSHGSCVTSQFVASDAKWFLPLAPQRSSKETLDGALIATRLN